MNQLQQTAVLSYHNFLNLLNFPIFCLKHAYRLSVEIFCRACPCESLLLSCDVLLFMFPFTFSSGQERERQGDGSWRWGFRYLAHLAMHVFHKMDWDLVVQERAPLIWFSSLKSQKFLCQCPEGIKSRSGWLSWASETRMVLRQHKNDMSNII